MKVLTSVTILLAIPTLVASLYGMNVILPGRASPAHAGRAPAAVRRAVLAWCSSSSPPQSGCDCKKGRYPFPSSEKGTVPFLHLLQVLRSQPCTSW